MAAKKDPISRTPTAGNDISTPQGFLAEYRVVAGLLNDRHGWCDNGTRYPYDTNITGGLIPKVTGTEWWLTVPDEALSDRGRELAATQITGTVETYREGAMKAILYGLSKGQLTFEEAECAAERMGLPKLTKSEGYRGYLNSAVDVTTDTKPTTEQIQAVHATVTEAITTALAAIGAVPSRFTGAKDNYISLERNNLARFEGTGQFGQIYSRGY